MGPDSSGFCHIFATFFLTKPSDHCIIYTMKTLLILALLTLATGCTVAVKDTRCTWNQYCPYTDAPPAIRTEPIRSTSGYSGSTRIDPAVR
jgi:hypothetical protein